MANHNPNGRNVTRPDENRPSWRPQDQQQASSTQRSRDFDDDRGSRMQREEIERFGSSSRMGSNWEDDRDEGYRGTERFGQGQSGYGGGRIEGDRSWNTRNQTFGGRGQVDNQDDRWSGRGGQGYYEGAYGEDRGRMGHRTMGGDFDADEYNSGYHQGAMGYGGYGMSGPQQGMGARGFRDESQGRYGGQDRGMADGRWGNQRNQYGGGSYGGMRDIDRGGYGRERDIDMQRGRDMQRNRGMQDSYGMQGGYGGGMRSMYQGDMGDMRYGQGHQGMGHTQGQGFGESGYGMNQQRGLGHRGKGPQGWQRSDDRIKETVCEMLHDDDDIDASRIQVDVKNCEVTLTGAVPERHMKRAAEDLVERCSGVKDVQNNLRVQNETRGNNGHASNAIASSNVSRNETETSGNDKKHRA